MKEKIKLQANNFSTKIKEKNFTKPTLSKLNTNNQYRVRLFKYKTIRFAKSPKIVLGLSLIIVFFATVVMARGVLGRFNQDDRINPPEAIASQDINTKFDFPIRDIENVEVAKVAYEIEKASLQNSFIYQGKLAKSVQGRTFLIFDLKITNPYEKGIEINTIDYIRIKRNNINELLAPEIHNDPVQIQANSTKYTRIGIPINETDKDIKIFVGELQGEKEEVSLNF